MYGEIFIYPSHHALAWVQHCRASWLHALAEVSPLGAWGPGAAQKSAKRCDVAVTVTVTRTGRGVSILYYADYNDAAGES